MVGTRKITVFLTILLDYFWQFRNTVLHTGDNRIEKMMGHFDRLVDDFRPF